MTAPDVEARRAALVALGARTAPDPGVLRAFLADDDWRVRKDAAAEAARHLGEPRVRALLCEAVLQGEDVGLRNAAIEALTLAPPPLHGTVATLLAEALARAAPTARKFVCAALVGGGTAGVPLLLEEAVSADAMTASAAVEALARIEGPAAEVGLARALGADSQVVRLAALEGLIARGARVPIDVVRPHLADPLLRNRALELAGLSEDDAAIPLCVRALAEPRTRTSATLGLSRLGRSPERSGAVGEALAGALDERTVAALCVLIDGADLERAEAAAHVLLSGRAPASLAPLCRLAARAELGGHVLSALSAFGAAALVPLVAAIPSLEGAAAAWALEVASELAEGAPPNAVSALREAVRRALGSNDPQLLVAAASACAAWAEDADAARLVVLGAHGDPRVAAAAGDALAALARRAPGSVEIALENEPGEALFSWSRGASALPPKMALEKLKETISGGDPAARRAAVEALVLVDGEDAADLAGIALADEDPRVRLSAVRTLSELRAEEARPLARASLLYALRAPDAPVRAAAVRALASLGEPLEADTVLRLARDEAPEVVAAIVARIGEGAGPGAAAVLDVAAASPDPEVQKEIVRAVLRAGDPRAQDWLVERLASPAWDVRREAALALVRLGPPGPVVRAALEARLAVEPDDLVRAAMHRALGSGD